MATVGEKVMQEIIEYIALGVYKVDDKLPSVRELSMKYHVNPNTIAKVYATLEEKGYLYALAAKGYYVAKHNEYLEENVLNELKSHLHEVWTLSKIINYSHQDIIDLLEKEDDLYD